MQNPLDTPEIFQMDLMNPNPSSSKTKEGPKYRISFEVDRETWDCFMITETAGMVIEAAARVTYRNHLPVEENKPKRDPNTIDAFDNETDAEKGGPLSQRSDHLARTDEFQRYMCEKIETGALVILEEVGDLPEDVEVARAFIRQECGVKSRKELDHSDVAASKFKALLSDYLHWSQP